MSRKALGLFFNIAAVFARRCLGRPPKTVTIINFAKEIWTFHFQNTLERVCAVTLTLFILRFLRKQRRYYELCKLNFVYSCLSGAVSNSVHISSQCRVTTEWMTNWKRCETDRPRRHLKSDSVIFLMEVRKLIEALFKASGLRGETRTRNLRNTNQSAIRSTTSFSSHINFSPWSHLRGTQ